MQDINRDLNGIFDERVARRSIQLYAHVRGKSGYGGDYITTLFLIARHRPGINVLH